MFLYLGVQVPEGFTRLSMLVPLCGILCHAIPRGEVVHFCLVILLLMEAVLLLKRSRSALNLLCMMRLGVPAIMALLNRIAVCYLEGPSQWSWEVW